MEDLRESIAEMDEMEQLRIEAELEKQQQGAQGRQDRDRGDQHRDSGTGVAGLPQGDDGLDGHLIAQGGGGDHRPPIGSSPTSLSSTEGPHRGVES